MSVKLSPQITSKKCQLIITFSKISLLNIDNICRPKKLYIHKLFESKHTIRGILLSGANATNLCKTSDRLFITDELPQKKKMEYLQSFPLPNPAEFTTRSPPAIDCSCLQSIPKFKFRVKQIQKILQELDDGKFSVLDRI